MDTPSFRVHGDDDPAVRSRIQPELSLRPWGDLGSDEKAIVLQGLRNMGVMGSAVSSQVLKAVEYLNHKYMRVLPGKALHAISPVIDPRTGFDQRMSERRAAAAKDFCEIALRQVEDIVLALFSAFVDGLIDPVSLGEAERQSGDSSLRRQSVDRAYGRFDAFAKGLNHIFEQFAVNQVLTRNGFVPRQDAKITESVYEPVLRALSDPRWRGVDHHLAKAFAHEREGRYPEAIDEAHNSVLKFLLVLTGSEESENAKGLFRKKFVEAKRGNLIPQRFYSEECLESMQKFLADERSNSGSAKPNAGDASSADALLVLNAAMVFMQYCLQKPATSQLPGAS